MRQLEPRALALAAALLCNLASATPLPACSLQVDYFGQQLPPRVNSVANGITESGQIWGTVNVENSFISIDNQLQPVQALTGDSQARYVGLQAVSPSGATLAGASFRQGQWRAWVYQDGVTSYLATGAQTALPTVAWVDDSQRAVGGLGSAGSASLFEAEGGTLSTFGAGSRAPVATNALGNFLAPGALPDGSASTVYWRKAANGTWKSSTLSTASRTVANALSDTGLAPYYETVTGPDGAPLRRAGVIDARSRVATPLPLLAGFSNTDAASISADGQWIVGTAYQAWTGSAPFARAVRWHKQGSSWKVTALPRPLSEFADHGLLVNSRGDAVYQVSKQTSAGTSDDRYALYRGGVAKLLENAMPGSKIAAVKALNEQGQIAASVWYASAPTSVAARIRCD